MEFINCAIIENNVVVNVIVAESLEKAIEIFGGEIIAVNNNQPWIGWIKNEDGTFSAPVETVVENGN